MRNLRQLMVRRATAWLKEALSLVWSRVSVTEGLAIFIVILHVLLSVSYSVVTPLWESFDEWGHYPYVDYVAQERALPQERLVDRNDETHQPPLYYVLGALATFWIDTGDGLLLVDNEYSVHKGGEGGVRLHLPRERRGFSYSGTALAARMTRILSLILGAVSVVTTYFAARTLFEPRKGIALGALAVSAFWPQLLFMGAVINNDIMVTACASLVLLFLVRMLVGEPRSIDALGLALSLGAALLSKRNGLALVPFVLIGLVIIAIERRRHGKATVVLPGGALLLVVGVAAASVWWFDGVWETYQDYFMSFVSTLSDPGQLTQLHWGRLPSGLYFCLATFFASFGHVVLGVEAWVYALVAVVCVAASFGLVFFFVGKQSDHVTRIGVLILILHLAAVIVAPAYRTLSQGGEAVNPTVVSSIQPGSPLLFSENVFLLQGRFVLPAISSFSILLPLGLTSLMSKRHRTKLSLGLGLTLLGFSTLAPFRYIRPAYARPRQLSPSALLQIDHPLHITFGQKVALIGYEIGAYDVLPGAHLPVTLYWHCLDEMERNYVLDIEVLGPTGRVYGAIRLHPGHGNFPTSLWEVGEVFSETYLVRIAHGVPTPSLAYLKVSFQTRGSPEDTLDPLDEEGHPVSPTFAQLAIRSGEEPEIEHETYFEFGGEAALVGYRNAPSPHTDDELEVTLFWRALQDIEKDYVVFVHLIDETGELVSQHDGQPNHGLAPTRIWQPDELVEDRHVLPLAPTSPEGYYLVQVGLYDAFTLERVSAFTADGSRMLHDVVILQQIQVPSSVGVEQ